MKIAFKVDVDTLEGTKKGALKLASLFKASDVDATFLFALGEDQMGRSIFRAFNKGFIAKCLKSNVAGNYPLKTLLRGTLLPSPVISEKCPQVLGEIYGAGFECGVHSWSHYKWQNRLPKMKRAEIEREFCAALNAVAQITGHKCVSCGSAGWQVSADYLALQDEFSMRYSSDSRGAFPFVPRFGGRVYNTIQIPSTLPTLDEFLCRNRLEDASDFYASEIAKRDFSVMTIHAELEGTAFFDWFEKFLERLKKTDAQFVRLRDYAETLDRSKLPVCDLQMSPFPERSGLLAVQKV